MPYETAHIIVILALTFVVSFGIILPLQCRGADSNLHDENLQKELVAMGEVQSKLADFKERFYTRDRLILLAIVLIIAVGAGIVANR